MSLKVRKLKRLNHNKKPKQYDDIFTGELAECIEELTHSGKKTLNSVVLKKVKNICKNSDKYVKEAYNLIMTHLEEDHAEVRLSAFQICDEIFRKSHCFREQVILCLEKVVELTTGACLPPPKHVARELRKIALKTIQEWAIAFSDGYKKLALGYKYLKQVEKVDFNAVNASDTASHGPHQENQRRLEAINRERIKKVLAELKDTESDVKLSMASLSSCINLLLPPPDDFFITEDNEGDETNAPLVVAAPVQLPQDSDSENSQEVNLREVGMVNVNHSVQLHFTPSSEANIEETSDNSAIIDNAHEHARLITNRHLPSVKAWLEVISKSSAHEKEKKSLQELKGELEDLIHKYRRLIFYSNEDVSSDSELEEVPESKPVTSVSIPKDQTIWSILSEENKAGLAYVKKPLPDEPRPCSSSLSQQESEVSDRKRKLLAVAPKLPFDVDLYHWEDDKLPVPTLISTNTEGHRFWVGSEGCPEELPVPDGSSVLRTRVIEFTGSFTPVTHSCRVRQPSGKLCPRQDRLKCPFHGEIVPRDETGKCVNPEDAVRMQEREEKRQQKNPDWQNPKLLAEIKKATGIDLKMPEKGKRMKRKREYPGLTDLKGSENTAKKRLEKKIFNKSVMKKVASAMDKAERQKFKDKFGDQFQYFYNS